MRHSWNDFSRRPVTGYWADKSIRITGKDMEEEVVSRLAYENGILITALERRRYTLEDYYMNLKNGGAGAC